MIKKLFFVAFFPVAVTAQYLHPAIDTKNLKYIVRILSSDSMAGRATGTNGSEKAAQFISDQFERLGLNYFNESTYIDAFSLGRHRWGEIFLKTQSHTFLNFNQVIIQGNHYQSVACEKPLIFGGLGHEEELNQIDVTDKWVLVLVNNLRSTYDLNTRLANRGAFGLLAANPDNDIQFESIKRTLKDHALQERLVLPRNSQDSIQKILWRYDSIKFISALLPSSQLKHVTGLTVNRLLQLTKTKRLTDLPQTMLTVKYEKKVDSIKARNIIGLIRGQRDSAIVISAHYDHLGSIGEQYFPGADDNASGVAVLLELAKVYSFKLDLPYTLIFLVTDAEEQGLLGSTHFMDERKPNAVPILCNINLDMIGRIDAKHKNGNYLYCLGTDQHPWLDSLVKQASKYVSLPIDFSLNNSKDAAGVYTRSDNYSFYNRGIPAIFFFSGLHGDYHSIADTPDKINYTALEKRAKLVYQLLNGLLMNKGE